MNLFFYCNHAAHTIVCEGIEGGNKYGEKTVVNAGKLLFPGTCWRTDWGAVKVTVTPRYTEERTEDAVRLTGIYHIAANVEFDEGSSGAEEWDDSFILIDDVEVDGKDGYFEYAVPLNIDLPSIAEGSLEIVTTQCATGKPDGQGTYGVVWNVECTYTEAVALVEEPVEVQVVVATPLVAINSTPLDELDEVLSFIAELDRWRIDDSLPFK